MPAKSRDAQPPGRLTERLKSLHELGAAIKRQEAALKANAPPLRSAMPRLLYLRAMELRGWTLTPAELAEHRQLERETELDQQEEREGSTR